MNAVTNWGQSRFQCLTLIGILAFLLIFLISFIA
jgi:hypothetical protein